MSAACGWNGCPASGDPDMDGRCEEHEFSQCRTEGCTGDAADGDSWDGFCREGPGTAPHRFRVLHVPGARGVGLRRTARFPAAIGVSDQLDRSQVRRSLSSVAGDSYI